MFDWRLVVRSNDGERLAEVRAEADLVIAVRTD